MDVRYLKNSLFETQTEKAIFPMSLFLKLKKKISFTLRFRKSFCTFLLFVCILMIKMMMIIRIIRDVRIR